MQLTLELSAPASRRSDPITSHAAAASAKTFSADHQMRIVEALKAHGPAGKTEIACRAGLDGVACARRLPELQRAGLVTLTGRCVPSASGRDEREWEAV